MADAYYGLCDWDKFPVMLRLVAQSTLQDGRWVVYSRVFSGDEDLRGLHIQLAEVLCFLENYENETARLFLEILQ